jgi:hypothetical protein
MIAADRAIFLVVCIVFSFLVTLWVAVTC